MSISKIVGIVLIVVSLILGYLGINKVVESDASVDIVGIEIEASDNSKKTEGYFYLGFAVVIFIGGIYIVSRK